MLDVAGCLLLVEVNGGKESARETVSLDGLDFCGRADAILRVRPDHLICGQVSNQLDAILAGSGIMMHTLVCGEAERTIEALIAGQLDSGEFRMPVCRGRGSRFRCGRFIRNYNSDEQLAGESTMRQGGRGKGAGRGRGKSMQEADGNCICHGCGFRQPHIQGKPCRQITCPQCGMKMSRE